MSREPLRRRADVSLYTPPLSPSADSWFHDNANDEREPAIANRARWTTGRRALWRRTSYSGALLFNVASFLLPALYGTLVKLWVADIDTSLVVTTDVYTYIGVFAEVLNEGLPRAAWLVIGDAALAGLAYFLSRRQQQTQRALPPPPPPLPPPPAPGNEAPPGEGDAAPGEGDAAAAAARLLRPSVRHLVVLLRPGAVAFAESAVRNVLYLWLVSTIVALGATYATAWGIFNTIRWGLVMVPVQALEATSLAFVGHRWGAWRHRIGVTKRRPDAVPVGTVLAIAWPALVALGLALAVEVPLAVALSVRGARPFARYLSGSDAVADVTAYMWKTIDWCYLFYAAATQAATVLLATRPPWYLYQSLASNLLYVVPWAIVCQTAGLREHNAWTYHRFVFGGSLVFGFLCVAAAVALWAWTLVTGRARLAVFRA